MSRAERLVKPIGLGRELGSDVLAIGIGVSEMCTDFGGISAVSRSDELALEVVGGLDHLAGTDNNVGCGVVTCHEASKALTVIVDVLKMRSSDGSSIVVDVEGEGLLLGDGSVGLRLDDDTDCRVIREVGTHAVRDTGDLLAHALHTDGTLSDGSDRLEGSMWEVDVTRLSVDDFDTRDSGVGGLRDQGSDGSDGVAILHVLLESVDDILSTRDRRQDSESRLVDHDILGHAGARRGWGGLDGSGLGRGRRHRDRNGGRLWLWDRSWGRVLLHRTCE